MQLFVYKNRGDFNIPRILDLNVKYSWFLLLMKRIGVVFKINKTVKVKIFLDYN